MTASSSFVCHGPIITGLMTTDGKSLVVASVLAATLASFTGSTNGNGVTPTVSGTAITFAADQTLPAGAPIVFASQPNVTYFLASAISAGTAGVLTQDYTGPAGATNATNIMSATYTTASGFTFTSATAQTLPIGFGFTVYSTAPSSFVQAYVLNTAITTDVITAADSHALDASPDQQHARHARFDAALERRLRRRAHARDASQRGGPGLRQPARARGRAAKRLARTHHDGGVGQRRRDGPRARRSRGGDVHARGGGPPAHLPRRSASVFARRLTASPSRSAGGHEVSCARQHWHPRKGDQCSGPERRARGRDAPERPAHQEWEGAGLFGVDSFGRAMGAGASGARELRSRGDHRAEGVGRLLPAGHASFARRLPACPD